MGNSSSTLEVPGGGYEGYHVLKVSELSPAYFAGLEPFFDYILSINDVRLLNDDDTFKKICSLNIDTAVKLTVYSSKYQSVRDAMLTPSNTWGGNGVLGLHIRHCSFENATENIWHILSVQANSPAAVAGLRPETDYIIATDSTSEDRDDLLALVERFNMKPLRLFVYNTEEDKCREITIVPNNNWEGEGSLGCGIGSGYLHRIPKPIKTKVFPARPDVSASPPVSPTLSVTSSVSQPALLTLHDDTLAARSLPSNLQSSPTSTGTSPVSPFPSSTLPSTAGNLPFLTKTVPAWSAEATTGGYPVPSSAYTAVPSASTTRVEQNGGHGHSHGGAPCTGHHPPQDDYKVRDGGNTSSVATLQVFDDAVAALDLNEDD